MSVLVNKDTRLICQGFTGAQGTFQEKTDVNATVIYVPAKFAADAILEAIDAEIELIVCITEGIPILDKGKARSRWFKQSIDWPKLSRGYYTRRMQNRNYARTYSQTWTYRNYVSLWNFNL